MNHLLYNISIVMLLIGTLMLTYYLTKVYNTNNINLTDIKEPDITLNNIYDNRPSQTFKVMFNEPSIWQGYETINNDKPLGAKAQI